MELIGYNSSIGFNIGLKKFVNKIINSKTSIVEPMEGWYVMSKSIWENISKELSNIENCEAIIKSQNRDGDIIYFITEDISTKNIMKINQKYSEILDEVEEYFEIQVINKNEFSKYENNKYNNKLWEKKNA